MKQTLLIAIITAANFALVLRVWGLLMFQSAGETRPWISMSLLLLGLLIAGGLLINNLLRLPEFRLRMFNTILAGMNLVFAFLAILVISHSLGRNQLPPIRMPLPPENPRESAGASLITSAPVV